MAGKLGCREAIKLNLSDYPQRMILPDYAGGFNQKACVFSSLSFQAFWPSSFNPHCPIHLANKQVQNPVVGRRLPNSASHGAFLVTCFLSFRHHRDWNVRQLPSKASILAKSLCLHNRSQNTILLVVTPAFFATIALLFNYPNQLILIISKILIIAAISTFNYRKYSATTLDCRYSPALYPGRSGD